MSSFQRSSGRCVGRRAAPFFLAFALVVNALSPVGAAAAQSGAPPRLSEEGRVVHVLNRLGFGPRPGDVERVRRVGVERYIEEQLRPETIRDEGVEAKLRDLPTLRMSNGELLAKYPNPGMLFRRLERRGELPEELAALRRGAPAANGPTRRQNNEGSSPERMNDPAGEPLARPGDGAVPGRVGESAAGVAGEGEGDRERRAYRRAALEYMRERGLEPPQRILAELQAARVLRAAYSGRQLQEVMVDFWSNHFNVFAGKGADRWLLTSFDRDTIRPHALGNFRELLGAVAKSPAMLFYLDNYQSVSPQQRNLSREERRRMFESLSPETRGELLRRMNRRQGPGRGAGQLGGATPGEMMREGEGGAAQVMRQPGAPARQSQGRRRGINENYARELMELHTLGVEGGYTQRDVQEVARAFTGWTILDPRGALGMEGAGEFVFNPRAHDDGEKVVLGQKIPAAGGQRDGELVLDILARHASTARFIAMKLCRRFVADEPSPALVARVGEAFTKSGGDIKQTLRAVFASPEFNSAEARRAKIKTPFELAVSAVRALGAETDGGPAFQRWVARMGEPLYMYQAPTGYPDRAEHWVNTGALLERLNFALALTSNRIPGTRVDLARFAGEAATSSRAVDQRRLVDLFSREFLRGDVTPKTKEVLLKQLGEQQAPILSDDAAAGDDRATERNVMQARRERRETGAAVGNPEVTRIAALILGSPEFQRQ